MIRDRYKIHFDCYIDNETEIEKTMCGSIMPSEPDNYNYSRDWNKVTCKRCLKRQNEFNKFIEDTENKIITDMGLMVKFFTKRDKEMMK